MCLYRVMQTRNLVGCIADAKVNIRHKQQTKNVAAFIDDLHQPSFL